MRVNSGSASGLGRRVESEIGWMFSLQPQPHPPNSLTFSYNSRERRTQKQGARLEANSCPPAPWVDLTVTRVKSQESRRCK